jgi:hypothetical protein
VKNGSIANTSVGLFYDYIRKEDGRKFPIALAHVALTNHPWINGMQPFGMSESENLEINSLEFSEKEENKIENATLIGTFNGNEYLIPLKYASTATGTVNFTMTSSEHWIKKETSEEQVPRNSKKGGKMPKNLEELEGLGLADDVAEKVAELLQKKEEELTARETELEELRQRETQLAEDIRKGEVEKRIDELKDLGLSDQPGFLKVVRQVLLSDTGENSLTLSEDGNSKSVSFTDVVNDLIDALPKKEGKINFGEQIESVTTDEKPPADAAGENETAEQRLAKAHEFLYGKSSK